MPSEAVEHVEAKIAECEAEKRRAAEERQDVDIFVQLQEFFDGIREASEFVDPYAILRAVVHHVEVNAGRKRVSVALNLREAGSFSNRESAEKGSAAPETGSSAAVSAAGASVVSAKTFGEADGTRTRNPQIDSLVL